MLRKRMLAGAAVGLAMGAASMMATPAQAGFLFAFLDGQLTNAEILSALSNMSVTVGGDTESVVRVDDTTSGENLIPTIVPPNTFTDAQANAIITEVASDTNTPSGFVLEGVGSADVTYDLNDDPSLFLFVKAAGVGGDFELVYHEQQAGEETHNVIADCPACGFNPDSQPISNLRVFAVPLPAALPLLASALGALGFFGWMRRRSSTA